MASIFISHSKRDEATINAFCRAFAQTTIRAVLEDFDTYVVPPWAKIAKDVQESSAVFLLLSPHLNATAYTQNWVSYEVGLACAMKKPVWVYEQSQAPVHSPVPYLTDYVLYDPTCQEQLTAIKNLVNSYDPSPALAGIILGGLIGGLISGGPGLGVGAIAGGAVGEASIPNITLVRATGGVCQQINESYGTSTNLCNNKHIRFARIDWVHFAKLPHTCY